MQNGLIQDVQFKISGLVVISGFTKKITDKLLICWMCSIWKYLAITEISVMFACKMYN